MSEEKNVPNIRFKGFTDPWEQRKLGEVANIVGGGTPSTSNPEYWNGSIDWYTPAEIGDHIYINNSKKKITELGLKKSSAQMLPKGTILFTSRAGIGNTGILIKEGSTNQGFQSIVPKGEKLDSYFIYTCSNMLKRYGEKYGAGSTFIEISGRQMTKMPINVPAIKEQSKIGHLSKKVDITIALHQQKVTQLKELKKLLMQKIFDQEWRFKGFTDPWEQRKLGEVVTSIIVGGDIDKSKILRNGKYPVYANALTDDGIVGYYDDQYRVKAPAVTVTGRGKIGIAKARNSNFTPVVRLLAINSSHNNYFLANLINTNKMFVESTGVPQLTAPQLSNYKMKFPNNLEEEIQIGVFFSQLDSLIDLHQQKVDQLKELKKYLMQNLFV
ncbi:restriction endonuclease subunit S [Pediococcus acidilactici]|uniref:restriction endonuclease subunit S n=1 Tax=Pediococcus acidilactici TaxID=1254 RepID=UPI00137BC547|nr:restriction endonuclease subunit S [Pediococcus acidilactici]QHS02730.1 restriction endonuclease subunit S [Pediococcus acidilactici]